MTAVFLACLAGVFSWKVCWCGRLRYWNGLREGRLEKILLGEGWVHRGKGGHSRFPATELGMILAELALRSSRRGGGSDFSLIVVLRRAALGLA